MRSVSGVRLVILGALFALLPATGCGAARTTEAGPSSAPAAAEPAMLHVQNNHWSDITIWVVTGGQRNRLGRVTAASAGQFIFPRYALNYGGELRLVATALADRRPLVTETIMVRPGSVVEWTLESSLERSSLAVY